ncbi:MAG: glycoside hydrolase family 65 protein [Proteobacteria bacterium]|nr:glycoside hydrolase family 65 protein [Pseudomonadota bacterium]
MKTSRWLFALAAQVPLIAFAADATFTLTATAADWDRYFPGYLANGYLSTMTAPRGSEGNLAYLAGFMDYTTGDMARPAAIPGWNEIDYSTGDAAAGHFWMNRAPLDAAWFRDYAQTLDMRAATLTTRYTYIDHARSTQVKITTFVSQAAPHLAATQIELTPDFDGLVQLSFAFNLWAPHQPRFALARLTGDEVQEAVTANNLQLVAIAPATPDRAALWYHGDTHVLDAAGDAHALTLRLDGRAAQGLAMAAAAAVRVPADAKIAAAKVYRSPYRLALDLDVEVRKGKTYAFDKFVGVSRQGWGGDAAADLELAIAARAAGFDGMLAAHQAAWQALWKSDIVIDGDAAAQKLVHADLYYLLAASTADTHWSIGACALTPNYAGHIFWDADAWLFPALLLLHPQRAKSLVAFRAHTLPAAQARARAAGLQGAKYPWEADPENGTEQVPYSAGVLGEREIHVNADIALAQWQYWLATHDRNWLVSEGWPVLRNLADFWVSRATWNPGAKRYEILHVTSVAESYNDVPNDTYTNASAQESLRAATAAAAIVGAKADPKWAEVAARLYVPFSTAEQRHTDFDPSVPQARREGSTLALLLFPPLDYPMPTRIRRNDWDYVKSVIHADDAFGMTMGPMSIAAAAAGDAQAAVAWLQGNLTIPLVKPPFDVRTESTDNNTGYFITASGGYIQSLLYGLTGLRLTDQGLVEKYAPVLPAPWRSLTLKNVAFHGVRYDIVVARGADGRPILKRLLP